MIGKEIIKGKKGAISMDDNLKPYNQLFKNIKIQILSSRNKALKAVNKEMIELYWNIGYIILRN